jgi:hypothetical protein
MKSNGKRYPNLLSKNFS